MARCCPRTRMTQPVVVESSCALVAGGARRAQPRSASAAPAVVSAGEVKTSIDRRGGQ